MTSLRVGFFYIYETFNANGDIDVAIRDKRTGELVCFRVNLEDYEYLLSILGDGSRVGILAQFVDH
jgi:hypothetical protein